MATINNTLSNTLISGTSGKDTIWSVRGDYVTINSGAGDDSIRSSGSNVSIDSGADNDYVSVTGSNVTIDGGDGNDKIYRDVGNFSSIFGGAGNDNIQNFASYVTIEGGKGDDSINAAGRNVLIEYRAEDGNDIITNFNSTDTLKILANSYSMNEIKNHHFIITVGDGEISLSGKISSPNIEFEEIETNSWMLDGTTAKYGTSDKTLVTVKGVKSLDGLSLKDKVVTVSKASLNAKKVTISGEGYTLKLGDDVNSPTISKKWSLDDSTATYNQIKTAGYKLASNAKSITYSKKSTTTLATVKGVKFKNGLSVSGKVITVAESSVNKKKITLTSDGYTLKLAEGLTPTTKKAAWSYKNGTATYKSSYKTDGYKLAKNSKSITYSKATTATTLATIKGAKSTSGLSVSGKKITLKNSALSKKVTVSGGYEFDFAKDYGTATITGSSKADTITARGKKISVNGGKGDDTIKILGSGTVSGGAGADIFYYKSSGSNVIADYAAEDKISIASGTAEISASGNDLILTVGSGKISVTGGANQTVTYFDANGEHIYKKSSDTLEGVKFTKSGKVVTLTDDYEADRFDVADFSNYKNKIVTINAANVSQALEIIGNKKSNVITGTGTDDYIDGGAGADSIKGGNGNDKIYGGEGGDSILGGNGSDTLSGGAGNDSLWGGAGSDSIYGGLGDDYLVGGDGRDIFVYNNGDGHDYIDDYEQGVDKIMILSGEKPYIDRTNLSNDVTYIIGEGSLVIKNGINTTIEFVDSNNRLIDKSTPSKAG